MAKDKKVEATEEVIVNSNRIATALEHINRALQEANKLSKLKLKIKKKPTD